MFGFREQPDPFQQLSDPYSDRRMLTQYDLDQLKFKYETQAGHVAGDEMFDKLTDDEKREKAIGKVGFAGTRIMQHYAEQTDVPQMTQKERDEVVDLSSKEARQKALGQLTQNGANPMEL